MDCRNSSEGILIEPGPAIDGSVYGSANLIIVWRDRKHLYVVDDLLYTLNTLHHSFRGTFQRGLDDLAIERISSA
jgi:hypothetical protein